MSFFTQKLANTFPIQSTVRQDQSSVGQKVFNEFAELVEGEIMNIISQSNNNYFDADNNRYTSTEIFIIDLDEEDHFPQSDDIIPVATFPTGRALPILSGTFSPQSTSSPTLIPKGAIIYLFSPST